MQIERLDHVNIRTARLEVLVAWYRDVLGLRSGRRPNFPFPGAWLYAGDAALVHLVGTDGAPGAGSEATLKLEHFAFSAIDLAGFEARLAERGERFMKREIPEFGIVQMNVWDPDGNHIHVDFVLPGGATRQAATKQAATKQS